MEKITLDTAIAAAIFILAFLLEALPLLLITIVGWWKSRRDPEEEAGRPDTEEFLDNSEFDYGHDVDYTDRSDDFL